LGEEVADLDPLQTTPLSRTAGIVGRKGISQNDGARIAIIRKKRVQVSGGEAGGFSKKESLRKGGPSIKKTEEPYLRKGGMTPGFSTR